MNHEANIDFLCTECEEAFENEEDLQCHVGIVHLPESNLTNSTFQCKKCDCEFDTHNDLEQHIQNQHAETIAGKKCENCGKEFITKWRLKKHMSMHKAKFVRTCHYFNSGKSCPFEKLGCKFLHSEASYCEFNEKCSYQKCQ